MPVVRRLLPLFALLLCAVVLTQALDVVACPDEEVVQHEASHAPGAGGVDADCLCHLAYVAQDRVPAPSKALFGGEPLPLFPGRARQHPARRRVERPPIG